MSTTRRWLRAPALAAAGALAVSAPLALSRGDTVVLKNGVVYRGTVDRDNTILWVYDGLKRVVLRDSKVARIESDASFRNLEAFRVEQPLTVHGGAMPKEVVRVEETPWNDRGRRTFAFEGLRAGKMVRMEQAINELGPYLVKYRGVDGYWQGQLATSQVGRDVILGILGKVDRRDANERIRVVRFLIQAEWYADARSELDSLARDFPADADLQQRVAAARASLTPLEAVQLRARIETARSAQQPGKVAELVRKFPTKDVPEDLVGQIRDRERADAAQAAADKALADELRAAADRLPKELKATWSKRTLEALLALKEAPDAVRDRFVAWQKAKAEAGRSPEALFALAMSGFLLGADGAVEDIDALGNVWTMRDDVRSYLAAADAVVRSEVASRLDSTPVAAESDLPVAVKRLDIVTRLARNMAPPLNDDRANADAVRTPRLNTVRDDSNSEPTRYLVSLPPEYHPLRKYPAVLALHDGKGPPAAIAWWSAEAARRGYIVVAPEFRESADDKEYHYSETEHAAIELALRDARRRYAIDSDRVFLGGQLLGANAAWDFGLAHPDEFAGVVVISGLPFKYVNRNLAHAERLPLYVALGDLAPAGNEVVFGQMLKPLIARAWDVTYLEYFRRGLESLPEEAPGVFDWMERRRRDPYPKAFDVSAARASDTRFYGVVVREFQTGRTTAPAAVDPFGKNLNPATLKVKTSNLSNLLDLKSTGVKRLDVWLSPKLFDFRKRLEVRINGRSYYKGMAKPALEPLLEDLRLRSDRQQVYWMKLSAG